MKPKTIILLFTVILIAAACTGIPHDEEPGSGSGGAPATQPAFEPETLDDLQPWIEEYLGYECEDWTTLDLGELNLYSEGNETAVCEESIILTMHTNMSDIVQFYQSLSDIAEFTYVFVYTNDYGLLCREESKATCATVLSENEHMEVMEITPQYPPVGFDYEDPYELADLDIDKITDPCKTAHEILVAWDEQGYPNHEDLNPEDCRDVLHDTLDDFNP